MNPFELADELIDRGYRIPIFNSKISPPWKGWQPITLENRTIDLGELLDTIKMCYVRVETELDYLKKKCSDYEKVLLEYSKQPTRTWQNGSPGTYDPMSGFHGAIYGETDDYLEAKKVISKWFKEQE